MIDWKFHKTKICTEKKNDVKKVSTKRVIRESTELELDACFTVVHSALTAAAKSDHTRVLPLG